MNNMCEENLPIKKGDYIYFRVYKSPWQVVGFDDEKDKSDFEEEHFPHVKKFPCFFYGRVKEIAEHCIHPLSVEVDEEISPIKSMFIHPNSVLKVIPKEVFEGYETQSVEKLLDIIQEKIRNRK